MAGDVPPGWDYNPASWGQRAPIIALALIGFAIAAYLSLYQYRLVGTVWEPFFGEGSRRVLDSELSRLLPVSDAALGALAYLADAVTGAIGGRARWRTMPWLVIAFGFLVGPLSAVSVGLVIAQPVLYDSWCTLCIVTAVISMLMVGPAMDEVLASIQHVKRSAARGQGWRAFWGRDVEEIGERAMTGGGAGESGRRWTMGWTMGWAMGAHTAVALLGVWITAAPAVFGYDGALRTSDHVAGPLVASFGCLAVWRVTRAMRWPNLVLGAWVAMAGWIFSPGEPSAALHGTVVGLLIVALSAVRGPEGRRVGGGWRSLWSRWGVAGRVIGSLEGGA
jgi:uncharacterized membrane protein